MKLHGVHVFSFWHACKKHFPVGHKMNTVHVMTFADINEETKRNDHYIRHHLSVRKLVIMYECEWDLSKKSDAALCSFLHSISFQERLQPRKILFGGRMKVLSMYEKNVPPSKGFAFDFVSLYPSIMVFSEYSVGHPDTILHSFGNPQDYFEMIHCRVLPPNNLWMPTLPLRLSDGRTVYCLCRICSTELNIAKQCTHSNDERAFKGAWVTPLSNHAVEDGYKILNIFEVHYFPRRSIYDSTTQL